MHEKTVELLQAAKGLVAYLPPPGYVRYEFHGDNPLLARLRIAIAEVEDVSRRVAKLDQTNP
jgi:hypothetical protein